MFSMKINQLCHKPKEFCVNNNFKEITRVNDHERTPAPSINNGTVAHVMTTTTKIISTLPDY